MPGTRKCSGRVMWVMVRDARQCVRGSHAEGGKPP